VDVYTRFFRAVVEAYEFTKANPRASAQITYNARPRLAQTLSPQLALESMMELASGYSYSKRQGQGYGFHYSANWQRYLRIAHQLGQTKRLLTPSQVLTNRLVKPANSSARWAQAQSKGRAFKLNSQFAKTKVPTDLPL
jgi:ABC-type nitrate/sulfonate/bicarbonate transport system substrate-binding protein